ncbi:hypothetical protein RN001_012182 [Aquatica leii]|uniref:Uncharacterized protein n=1 Tax=Aquatica leii TaxID=1421715 RepID=A0AAN7SPD6_9COLE|nr:hypothetical protein RN001_012182 [Aquatica leii]
MSKIPVYVGSKSLSVPALPTSLSISACSVSPRAGGYIKKLTTNADNSRLSLPASRSKTLQEAFKDKQFIFKKTEAKIDDCDEMLAITISCVMMMASNTNDIPDEYFVWADNYLSRIKDGNGKLPPNIEGILNHMALVRSDIPNPEVVTCRCEYYIQNKPSEADENK